MNVYEKKLQKINQKEFRVEKVIKRNGDKLYVKYVILYVKDFESCFNSWIDKRNIV